MRRTSEEERKLFEQDFREARPIKPAKRPPAKKKAAQIAPGGLNGNTEEKLKRGQLMPQARLDLHGLTADAAHRSLLLFLEGAQKRGLRLVLVITGKGNPGMEEGFGWMRAPHGVLKEMVPRWLNEKEFAALTAGVRAAHVRHGGGGALYVYLRKLR